jgi:cobalt-zinc-cadmium efflux system outer membrane protein
VTARGTIASLALALAACVSVPEEAGFDQVRELTAERLGPRIHWRQGTQEDARADEEVNALLGSPLSADAAVQIALLENRHMQAVYEELGIAQAELVQAGLLRNPVFAGSVRFPDRPPTRLNIEFAVVQDFLDLLLRPARKAIAEAQFEETRLSVAAEVIDFAAQVRAAYYEALGAGQVADLRKLVVDAAEASADLARRLHEAGNISDLQLARELGSYEHARVDWARADAERLVAREELTRQMGLWGDRVHWRLPEGLPDIPAQEMPLETLESAAIGARLDLAAARRQSEVLARALGVTRDWRLLGETEIGVSSERDSDGQWVTGPELALSLPIFDQGQAEVAGAVARLRRADHLVIALAVEIRSEVRAARDQLLALRRLVEHYRGVVIPLHEATVALTQEEYNYMLVGAFELIAAKQAEYDAYQNYVETVRDYWITRSELGRAIGGDPSTDADSSGPTGVELPPTPMENEKHEQHSPKERA